MCTMTWGFDYCALQYILSKIVRRQHGLVKEEEKIDGLVTNRNVDNLGDESM